MFDENSNRPQEIYLNFNANKIRWLRDSNISPTNIFCIGSCENLVNEFIFNNPNPFKYE